MVMTIPRRKYLADALHETLAELEKAFVREDQSRHIGISCNMKSPGTPKNERWSRFSRMPSRSYVSSGARGQKRRPKAALSCCASGIQ